VKISKNKFQFSDTASDNNCLPLQAKTAIVFSNILACTGGEGDQEGF